MAPVIGPTPSTSQEEELPPDPDAEGEEDEGSVNSAFSVSSITSEVGKLVDPLVDTYLEVQPDFCRVVSVDPSTKLSFVCCRGARCRKPHHSVGRKAVVLPAPGIYLAAVSKAGRIVGAVPDSRMTSDELEAVAASRRAADAELIARARPKARGRPVVEEVGSSSDEDEVPRGDPSVSAPAPPAVPPRRPSTPDRVVLDDEGVARIVEQLAKHTPAARASPPIVSTPRDMPGTPVPERVDPHVLGRTDGRISASPSRKFYAVTVGRHPGIYQSREEALAETSGFGHSNYRAFKSYKEAESYYSAFLEGAAAKREQDLQSNFRPPSILKKSVSLGGDGDPSAPAEDGPYAEKACFRCRGFHAGSPCPWEKTARSADGPPDWYYGVARGRQPGVYLSWGEANAQVSKFSGNLYEKFRTYEKAWAFVASYREASPAPPPVETPVSPPLPPSRPSVGGVAYPVGPLPTGPSRGVCIGVDKSAGRESELFGIPIQSEAQLQGAITPPNLSPEAQVAFAEAIPDGVSQPGTYNMSDAEDQTSTLTLSVATLASQNTDNKRLGRPVDFLWRQDRQL
jgi:hypothetical protein